MSTSHTSIGIGAHKHKKFEINRTKIKGGCQSGRKVVPHDSKRDLPLALRNMHKDEIMGKMGGC